MIVVECILRKTADSSRADDRETERLDSTRLGLMVYFLLELYPIPSHNYIKFPITEVIIGNIRSYFYSGTLRHDKSINDKISIPPTYSSVKKKDGIEYICEGMSSTTAVLRPFRDPIIDITSFSRRRIRFIS